MKLKICGQKHNIDEVAELHPDYLGFIFWEPSSRHFEGEMPALSDSIQKVGVFVDASIAEVLEKVEKYKLDAVQLHGNESSEFCKSLKERHSVPIATGIVSESHSSETLNQVQGDDLTIIKVFSIKDDFDFSILEAYEDGCDYYLFDTKGKLPGGNGYTFDWSVLNDYPSTKPYFLSGGIGLETVMKLQDFLNSPASKYCEVIDINSKFEIEPGLKDIDKLKTFKNHLE